MTILDYQERIAQSNETKAILKKKSKVLSVLRLTSFLFILLTIYLAYQYKLSPLYLLSVGFVVAFLILVKKHEKVEQSIQYHTSLEEVLMRYIARFDTSWKDSNEYSNLLHELDATSRDLDIFGINSLYQYICCANTVHGQEILTRKLRNQNPDKDCILQQQEAIQELSEKTDFLLELEARSRLIPLKSRKLTIVEAFISISSKNQSFHSPFLSILKWILPAITIAFFALFLLNIQPELTLNLFYGSMIVQLLLALIKAKRNKSIFNPISAFCENINAYQSILTLIEKEPFESEYLISLKTKISGKNSASNAIHDLSKLNDAIKFRFNLIAYVLLNSIFMWEFHCIDRFLIWSNKHNKNIQTWLEVIGEIESLISLSTLFQVKEVVSFPTISSETKASIAFEDLRHPLIDPNVSIGNDFKLDSTCIISGSNMSGKTTFLRTIGINLVLAYAGGPVLASSFDATIMKIFTSIRIEDSVDQGISMFYAELLRIRDMIEFSKTNTPMIAFIDEIFNGTNSQDRIIGAKETIRRLQGSNALTLVSTHDLELCTLSNENSKYHNYHFSEYYKDNKIYFDYKIKDGVSQTTNAQYLLKMVGIVE